MGSVRQARPAARLGPAPRWRCRFGRGPARARGLASALAGSLLFAGLLVLVLLVALLLGVAVFGLVPLVVHQPAGDGAAKELDVDSRSHLHRDGLLVEGPDGPEHPTDGLDLVPHLQAGEDLGLLAPLALLGPDQEEVEDGA